MPQKQGTQAHAICGFGLKCQILSKLFRIQVVLPFRMTAFRCLLISFGATLMVAQAKLLPDEVVERAAAQIDQMLIADLQKSKRVPESMLNDSTFVRRAYLGIIGRIPSAEEAGAFLDDKSVSRRKALIERLVASPGFDSHLFNWTADLLRVQTRQDQYGLGWHVWQLKIMLLLISFLLDY